MSDERGDMLSEAANLIYGHDEKGTRNDVHRPSAINPGDYEYVKVDEARAALKDGQKIAGPGGTCHHCGKAIVWRVWFRHIPTGNVVTFGYICAGILEMTDNRIDHEMNLLKRTVERQKQQLAWDKQTKMRRAEMTREHPDLVKVLDDFDPEESDGNWFDNCLARLKWGYDKYGSLRDFEIEKLRGYIKKYDEQITRLLTQPTPVAPLEEGRRVLTGEILAHKYQDSYQRHVKDHKMLVMLEDGNKVYGSVPIDVERHVDASESREYRGVKVRFTATVKRSKDDENFGFYSFPKKAEVL